MSKSMDRMTEDALLGAAKRLADLKYQWNVMGIHELVVDDPRNGGSVYHHVNNALKAALRHLGIDDSYTFYELVTQGQTPVEAANALRAEQAADDPARNH